MEGPKTAGYHHHQFKVMDEMKHHHVLKAQDALTEDLMFSFLPNCSGQMPAPLLCHCSSIIVFFFCHFLEAIRLL